MPTLSETLGLPSLPGESQIGTTLLPGAPSLPPLPSAVQTLPQQVTTALGQVQTAVENFFKGIGVSVSGALPTVNVNVESGQADEAVDALDRLSGSVKVLGGLAVAGTLLFLLTRKKR